VRGPHSIARAIDDADPARQVNERSSDSDADEREEGVRKENERCRGKKPTYHKTVWSIRIKLPPDIVRRCREQYKTDGAKDFWQRAAYEFIGENPDAAALSSSTDDTNHQRKPHRHRESSD
jgi:hypothetical protein